MILKVCSAHYGMGFAAVQGTIIQSLCHILKRFVFFHFSEPGTLLCCYFHQAKCHFILLYELGQLHGILQPYRRFKLNTKIMTHGFFINRRGQIWASQKAVIFPPHFFVIG